MPRTSTYRAPAWKKRAASVLTSPRVGQAVAVACRDRIPNHGLRFDTHDALVSPGLKAALFFRTYESSEIRMIRRHLAGVDTVVELGASLGFGSAHILSMMAPHGRLIAVEANPVLVPALTERLTRHAGGRRFDVIHAAVAHGSPRVRMAESSATTGSHVSDVGVEVPAMSLGEVLDTCGVTGRFSLVADIEGAEHGLIDHDREALARCDRAIVEFHRMVVDGEVRTAADGLASFVGLGLAERASDGPVSFLERATP